MKLVIEDEAGTRSIVPFARDEITVGRAAEGVTFRLTERNVSRRHARFVRASGGVVVEDLGSLTGTFVNGERISGRRKLREGDLVQIGDYDVAVLDAAAELGAGAPPPLPGTPRDVPRPPPASGDVEPTAPSFLPAVAAIPPAEVRPASRTWARVLGAAIVALVLGLMAGYVTGLLTAP